MNDPKADKLQDELDFDLISSNEDCSTTIENSLKDKSMLSQMENSESNDGYAKSTMIPSFATPEFSLDINNQHFSHRTIQTKDIGNKNQSNKNKKEYRAKDKQNCKT